MTDEWLGADVILSVTEHMNTDHRADTLTMIKPHIPEAVSAIVAGLDKYALHIIATDARGIDQLVALQWPEQLRTREDIRRNVVWLYRRAAFPDQRCAKHAHTSLPPTNEPTHARTEIKEERSWLCARPQP